MTISLSASVNSSTLTTLNFSGVASGASAVEIQLANKHDFQFCMAPIRTGLDPKSTSFLLGGLNQGTRYYARARSRLSNGQPETWSNIVGFYTPIAAAQNLTVPSIVIDPPILLAPEPILSVVALPMSQSATVYAGFPATNMLADSPVCMLALESLRISIQFTTSGAPIDTIALLRTSFPEATSWQVRAGATPAGRDASTPDYLSATAPFRASANLTGRDGYHGVMRLPAAQSLSYWQIDLNTGGASPLGLIQIDHLVVGLNRTVKNISVGATEIGDSLGSFARNRSGIANRQDGLVQRHVEFDISYMAEAQYQASLRDLHGRVNKSMLIVPNAKAGPYFHDRILYGALGAGKSTLASSLTQSRSFALDSLI